MDDPARQRQLRTIIGQDVMRLDRLISDVSDASRLDAELSRISAEPVDVVPILRTLAELDEATRDSENDLRIVVDAPASLMVWGVEDRLVQVLRNLIGNAQSFSPPRSAIMLRAREAGGAGEKFGQHSGLGLSISRQIVEALRGRISCENRRDGEGRVPGARFVVCLPRV